jgi:sugar lactone lactonase YvrE
MKSKRICRRIFWLWTVGIVGLGAMIFKPGLAAAGGVKPLLASGNAGDTVADAVLGQVNVPSTNFSFNTVNFVDGAGLDLQDQTFGSVAIDTSRTPNRVYVADTANNRVLGWSNITAFTTHAAADIVIGQPNPYTTICNNGGLSSTSLCDPQGLAVDEANGNLYIADTGNHRVLFYLSPFTTDTEADDVFGQYGSFNTNSCNNSGLNASTLCNPAGLAVDSNGNLYVADYSNNRVVEFNTPERITSKSGSGDTTADVVFGQAGSFTAGSCNNGGLSATTLCNPIGVAIDTSDDLYVADYSNNRALEYLTPLTTDTAADVVFGQHGSFTANSCNNSGISAQTLCNPAGVATDSSDNLYVADYRNHRALGFLKPFKSSPVAKKVFGQNNSFTSNLCDNTFSGTRTPANTKSLCFPAGAATDSSDNFYLADSDNNRVLEYDTPFTATTVATGVVGQGDFTVGTKNRVDGNGFNFDGNTGSVAIDSSVTPNRIYVVDTANNRVLGWNNISAFTTHSPANLVIGQPDSFQSLANNGGISATSLNAPRGIVVDTAGNLYVSDTGNNRVLEYNTPFSKGARAAKVFGQAGLFTTANCNNGGVSANSLCAPIGLALDGNNILYISDFNNNRVLEFANPRTNSTANNVFGQNGSMTSNACNDISLSASSLCNPAGVAVDSARNVYIADYSNHRVLEYNKPLTTNFTADLVFGQGNNFTTRNCNNGGVSASSLCNPRWVAVDPGGNLYVADTANDRVLEYNTPLTNGNVADLVFGQGNIFTENGCKATSASTLCTPDGIAVDTSSNLYVADTDNERVVQFLEP